MSTRTPAPKKSTSTSTAAHQQHTSSTGPTSSSSAVPGGTTDIQEFVFPGTERSREMVENVVSQFDRDGDGYLDRWELMVCARALALDETQESMFELFSEIQQEVVITKSMPDGGHGSGQVGGNSVQFNAFRVPNGIAVETLLEKYKQMDPISRLEKLFKLTDRDNDGYIGFNDLKGSSMAVKFQLSDEDITRLIETFGKPNTPGVDFVDFRDILLNSS